MLRQPRAAAGGDGPSDRHALSGRGRKNTDRCRSGDCRNRRRIDLTRCSRVVERMRQALTHVAVVVRDYDEAIRFYVDKLHFELLEDTELPGTGKRWVVVRPRGSTGAAILLARAASEEQQSRVGNQTGGRVAFFLSTDDFWRDYRLLTAAGVAFVREPGKESYGTVAVFEDLYGNRWDLVERKEPAGG